MKEAELISFIKSFTGEGRIGDDCAVLPNNTVVTTDMLVEGIHFRLETTSMEDLGWKSMAVNLSDIAAMAARPRFAVVSVSMPQNLSQESFEKLYAGLKECADAYSTSIIGGDICGGQKLVISITAIGDLHENGCMLRSGARENDVVVVSGSFGDSAAGLHLLEAGLSEPVSCVARHRRPSPRLCEAWSLVRQCRGRGALMDASDGLADALCQIAALSNVGIEIQGSDIPLSDSLKDVAGRFGKDALDLALYGGEDYELVGTLSAADWEKLSVSDHNAFKKVGVVKAGTGACVMQNGSLIHLNMNNAFQHF